MNCSECAILDDIFIINQSFEKGGKVQVLGNKSNNLESHSQRN